MSNYTFYTHPMSRGQIARWALHEVGVTYNQVIVEYGQSKPDGFLAANPMGKVPTLVHHSQSGDYVVSEAAAICAYLAEAEPSAGLRPEAFECADYLRWMFFAAGPVEQAITARTFGFEPSETQQVSAGFGSYDRMVAALSGHFDQKDFVCGTRFTMADVYVGSQVLWGLMFKTLPERPSFLAYADRLKHRPAYLEAKTVDMDLIKART